MMHSAPSDNPISKKLVVTSNELVEAKYNFTLWQKRVFVYLVSQIDRNDKEFKLQRIQIKDLLNFFNVKSKDDYNAIRRVPENLFNARIQTPYFTTEGFKRWRKTRILSTYTEPGDIQPGNAYIELKFNDDLRPHLLELNTLFTKYEIKNIIDLRSVYSFRFYELLRSRRYNRDLLTMSVEELKEMLDVETLYPKYANFKQKVIQTAQRELADHCDIGFTFRELKSGRGGRVERIEFSIYDNSKTGEQGGAGARRGSKSAPEDIEAVEVKNDPAEMDRLFEQYFLQVREFGISPVLLVEWLKKYSAEHLEACISDFLTKAKSGKLKETERSKQGGYLRTLVEKADFTVKTAAQKQKTTQRQQTEIREKQQQAAEQAATDARKLKAETEASRIRELLDDDPELLEILIVEINSERLREYTPAEYLENGLLRAYVASKVKARFPEAFLE